MELKDLTIQLNDNLKVTNIRWKSRSIEISTDGGKTFRRPTYYETINLYTADLCDCDGGSGTGGTVNTEKLKEQIKEAIINDETFKAEVAKLVKVENPEVDTDAIETNVKNSIIEDKVFKSEIAKSVTVDTESIKTDIKNDTDFKSSVAKLVTVPEVDTNTIATNVKTNLKEDTEFKSELAGLVKVPTLSNSDTLEKFSTNNSGELLFNGSKLEANVTVDAEMSDNSENAVQNKVIKKYIDDKSRTIVSMTKDDEDNINVVYSDGTKQSIGKLKVDLQGNFLTEGGFGNLRYYNGKLQYYDSSTSSWVDGTITSDNQFIVNITPQNMISFKASYDQLIQKIKLKFKEPNDTVIDNQSICIVEKVIIRRKKDSAPESETDGDLVLEIKRKDFGTYSNGWFIDTELSPVENDIYYYKAFPVSTSGAINKVQSEAKVVCKKYELYGFTIDQNESDPASMITYIGDNANYKSAKMNFETGVFDYGDWEDVWFIQNLKPCMLNYDGTVAYELNKNDYSKREDGVTASDISNIDFAGNAMVGIPKVYYKITDNLDNTITCYISQKKIDEDYHCYSHLDANGNEIDFCYIPIYNGSLDSNNRLRSLSGLSPMVGKTGQDEITFAKRNNINSDSIWYTEIYSDRSLINLLLLLIGKSTNTQLIFGTGLEENNPILQTGSMNDKGLFFGSSLSSQGVKVFGIENYWGNIWRRTAGYIYINNIQKVKMTYGKQDGSTCIGYNTDGEGYIEIENSNIEGSASSYINSMIFNSFGLFMKNLSGSSSTYYTDTGEFRNKSSIIYYSLFGGSYNKSNYYNGALTCALSDPVSLAGANTGCSLSCKPLASTDNITG